MKLSTGWLKEFVSIPWSWEELARRLSMAGLEVEGEEINITPNRGDCLSIVGIAREVSALQGKPLQYKKINPPKGKTPIKEVVQVNILDKKGCPRYMACAVLGVTIKPSPVWLQKRLGEVGVRPINNVVDCTNYVMWELGHPLHAFDHRFLKHQKIVVRTEKEKTRFTTLDGETRICEPRDLFICDGEGPVALAGIMGGANSEVRTDTRNIVIEAAGFDPQRIHATAKRLKLSTDSSYRFERGVDPNGIENALHRVVQLIVETAGGEPTKDWIDLYPQKVAPKKIVLPEKEVERILGTKIPPAKIRQILQALGFQVGRKGSLFQVWVPTRRFDMTRPIDLVEEIARHFGFENIPETFPTIRVGGEIKLKESNCLEKTTDVLLRFGFSEGYHLSFISAEEASLFSSDPAKVVFLNNPLSEAQTVLRPSLIPSLLKAAAFNAHRQVKDFKLFELARVFSWQNSQILEKIKLGLIAFGSAWPSQWQWKALEADFFFLKGVFQQLTTFLHLPSFDFQPKEVPPFLVEKSSASLRLEGNSVGWIGLFNSVVLKKWDIKIPVYGAELDWENLADIFQKVSLHFQSISKFPFVERDMALVVDQTLSAQKIEEAIWGAKIPGLQKVKTFDFYQGEGLEEGKKSIALHILYASPERTLTNEEVNQAHENLAAHLEKTIAAKLR